MSAPQTLAEIGEDALIGLFESPGGSLGEHVIVPNGDDAAAYFVEPRYVSVVTTDTLVEGRHFDLSYGPAFKVGRKLMAVNFSDVAAMGARPRYALLSLCFPGSTPVDVARGIASGVTDMARTYGVAVIGGNVSGTSGPITLGATLIGRAEPSDLVRRRGAQVGDAIFVTGQLGEARAGLQILMEGIELEKGDRALSLVSAQLDPTPRVAAGLALGRHKLAHAMCDVSDGFGQDLRRLLVPEGLGARIEGHALPISAALQAFCAAKGLDPVDTALRGGEDYEILFTAHPRDHDGIVQACAAEGTPVSRVGTVLAEAQFEVVMPDGFVRGLPGGFDHF